MKGTKSIVAVCACLSIALSPMCAFAQKARAPERSTEHSYKSPNDPSGSFCGQNAPDLMKRLEEINAEKNNQIENLKSTIADLEQQRQVIMQMSELKNQYQNALEKLSKIESQTQKSRDNDLTLTVDSLKTITRSGLILNAVSLLLKDATDEDLSKPETYTIGHLCKKNAESIICKKIIEEDKAGKILGLFPRQSTSEYRKLDTTLSALKTALDRISDPERKKELRTEVERILKEIPANIHPEAILNLIESKAPELGQIVSKDFPREKILACLSEKSDTTSQSACTGIIQDPAKREAFLGVVTNEAMNLGEHTSERFSTFFGEANRQQRAKLDSIVQGIVNRTPSSIQIGDSGLREAYSQLLSAEKSMVVNQVRQNNIRRRQNRYDNNYQLGPLSCEDSKAQLTGLAALFYVCPDTNGELLSIATKKHKEALDNANKKAQNISQNCQIKSDSVDLDDLKLNECKNLIGELLPKIKVMQEEYLIKTNYLQSQIAQISSQQYGPIEKLKKFIAEKYVLSCQKKSAPLSVKDKSLRFDEKCSAERSVGLGLYAIEGLSSDISNIFSQTTFGEKIDLKPHSSEIDFSREEIMEFEKACSDLNEQNKNKLQQVCSLIAEEKSQRSQKRDAQDWKEINKNYAIDYSESSPRGYVLTKKKSTLRLLGEGILPVIPTAIPVWFANYQVGQNINMMTEQAKYQKQLLHSIDVYNNNPWMYNYNYFMPLGGYSGPGYNFGP